MTEDRGPSEEESRRSSRHGELWGEGTPVVGMIHLLPLPGSPAYGGSMKAVLDRAREEASILTEGGLDGLLVENYGDSPFYPDRVPPETVASMAVAVGTVMARTHLPVGVNVLRNDAAAAVAVAAATGARFIRVNVHTGAMFTDQGLLEGRAHRTLRARARLDPSIHLLADVMVKHATPPPGVVLESAARDTWLRGRADGLILTGGETGDAADLEEVGRVRKALPPHGRLWIGSGAKPENIHELLGAVDGIIIGSSLHRGGVAGSGIDAARVMRIGRALGRG